MKLDVLNNSLHEADTLPINSNTTPNNANISLDIKKKLTKRETLIYSFLKLDILISIIFIIVGINTLISEIQLFYNAYPENYSNSEIMYFTYAYYSQHYMIIIFGFISFLTGIYFAVKGLNYNEFESLLGFILLLLAGAVFYDSGSDVTFCNANRFTNKLYVTYCNFDKFNLTGSTIFIVGQISLLFFSEKIKLSTSYNEQYRRLYLISSGTAAIGVFIVIISSSAFFEILSIYAEDTLIYTNNTQFVLFCILGTLFCCYSFYCGLFKKQPGYIFTLLISVTSLFAGATLFLSVYVTHECNTYSFINQQWFWVDDPSFYYNALILVRPMCFNNRVNLAGSLLFCISTIFTVLTKNYIQL